MPKRPPRATEPEAPEAAAGGDVADRTGPGDALIPLTELTRRVGMSVRTIRFYTSKGLVPPPVRRGRSGYYSAEHVVRLELIRELQEHGFTLSAIERYMRRIPEDAPVEAIALHRTLLTPWASESPETLSRRELSRRAGRPLTDDDLATLNALGIAFPTKRGHYQVSPSQLPVGVALLDLGLPSDVALATQDVFTAHGRAIVAELTELFRTKVWPAYMEREGASPDQLREMVEKFKPVTVAALVAAYESAVNEIQRETVVRRAR